MRYWEAVEANITAAEAIAECKRHQVDAQVREGDRALVEIETGDVIAEADDEGEYLGGDIIGFLGYRKAAQ